MNRRTGYTILALSFVFFITTFVLYVTREDDKVKSITSEKSTKVEKKVDEETDLPEKIGVKVFRLTEASYFYTPFQSEIDVAVDRVELYRSFFLKLLEPIDGTVIPVPPAIKLRALHMVEDKNLLVLDFTESLMKNFPGGTGAESEFIYYFVNNFCYNFPEIGGVRFLVDGDEKASLNGHLDLSVTFTPLFELLSEK